MRKENLKNVDKHKGPSSRFNREEAWQYANLQNSILMFPCDHRGVEIRIASCVILSSTNSIYRPILRAESRS